MSAVDETTQPKAKRRKLSHDATTVSPPATSAPRRHKRAPQRPPTLETDIYVSRKSALAAFTTRAQKLVDRKDIYNFTIHGLGAAITRAINVALYLKEKNPNAVSWTITTSTVNLFDDVEPEDIDDDLKTEVRTNSAIHIKIIKSVPTKHAAELWCVWAYGVQSTMSQD